MGYTHSVHLCCILRKSRTCQAIRISFSIRQLAFLLLLPFSLLSLSSLILQRFLNTFSLSSLKRVAVAIFFFFSRLRYILVLSSLRNEPTLYSSVVRDDPVHVVTAKIRTTVKILSKDSEKYKKQN